MSKEQIASKDFLKLTAKKTGPGIYYNFLVNHSMKLKLGLLFTDLCQPFEISGDLYTNIFNSCLQKQPPELFFRRATSLKKRLCHRCFPVNFAKFLRTPFFTEHLWWLLLIPAAFFFFKEGKILSAATSDTLNK